MTIRCSVSPKHNNPHSTSSPCCTNVDVTYVTSWRVLIPFKVDQKKRVPLGNVSMKKTTRSPCTSSSSQATLPETNSSWNEFVVNSNWSKTHQLLQSCNGDEKSRTHQLIKKQPEILFFDLFKLIWKGLTFEGRWRLQWSPQQLWSICSLTYLSFFVFPRCPHRQVSLETEPHKIHGTIVYLPYMNGWFVWQISR